jgi:hypothetical protein
MRCPMRVIWTVKSCAISVATISSTTVIAASLTIPPENELLRKWLEVHSQNGGG